MQEVWIWVRGADGKLRRRLVLVEV
jgi:hypothetical protein